MESEMVSTEWLKRTELFGGLDETRLSNLLSDAVIKSCSAGETIFRQGDKANGLYILIKGVVDLTVKTQEKTDLMTSKIEKEGAVFGTASLMEPFRYNVSAVCLNSSEVLVLDANLIRRDGDHEKVGFHLFHPSQSVTGRCFRPTQTF